MDTNKKTYDSHVQISKFLLKPYRYKTESGYMVDYWDLQDNLIKQAKYKKLNAEPMYFNPVIEMFLDKEIESRFAEVVDKIRKCVKADSKVFNFQKSEIEIIRNFFKFTYLRNKELFSAVKENSVLLSAVQGFSHSYMLGTASSSIDHFFKGKRLYILCNNSKQSFVSPHNVLYYVFYRNINSFLTVLTISPKLAICLSMEETNEKGVVVPIANEEIIKAFNRAAYLTEKNHTEPYLVGNGFELEELRKDCATLDPRTRIEIAFDESP